MKNELGNQLVCTVRRGERIEGYVVIDSTVGGQACGGLRMLPDIDEAEMRDLAQAMTLKYGLLGMPRGGAKAGIRADPQAPPAERKRRLTWFGQAIAPLLQQRLYVPGPDMGTDSEDIRILLEAAGLRVGRREQRSVRSGHYTALTVFTSIDRAAEYLNLPLAGSRAAIEGFGKVGSALAQMLDRADVKVVAISTTQGAIYNPNGFNVPQLTQLASSVGDDVVTQTPDAERIPLPQLLELPVDFLCPCARHDTIRLDNAPRVAARAICPGANNPLTPAAEESLLERGVLCLPDFVTNCGGVLGGTMEFASLSVEQIAALIENQIGPRIDGFLTDAERRGTSPRAVATEFALDRFQVIAQAAARPTPLNWLFNVGLDLYRRGWIPAPLVASLSLSYFERCLA